MTRNLAILVAAFFLTSCAQPLDLEFHAESEHLKVRAIITESETEFRDGFTKLSGTAVIHNPTSQAQQYSNMWLQLRSAGGMQERAYLDNLTSHHIDSGTVEIEPGDTIEIPVYWVFPDAEIEQLRNGGFVLEVRPSGET